MSDFTTEAFTLLGIGLGVIVFRTYARFQVTGLKGLEADDYLMMLAAVVYSIETVLAYSVGAFWYGLANNGMTLEERQALDPSSNEYRLRVNGSKTQLAGWSTYTLLLWILKAAMCAFYLRLTDGLEYYRIRIIIGFVIIGATWLTVLLSILLGCQPFQKNWQIYPDPGNSCQPAISKVDIFVTVVLNAATDLYLLSIPVPMLWCANLPMRKKLSLIALFSGGIFVTMAGILRCVLIITNPVTGAEEAGYWACRETFVAVVTTNLPMIFPYLRRWFSPIFGTVTSQLSKGWAERYGSAKRPGLPQHGSIRLDDCIPTRHDVFHTSPYTQTRISRIMASPSDEMGIRKDTEVRVEEELLGNDGCAGRHYDDLSVVVYGSSGIKTEVEHGMEFAREGKKSFAGDRV